MTAIWTGTYRLQMHKGFPLRAATQVLPYLKSLGISHVYLSPSLQALPGSTHGYDVTDPTQVNPELGGEADWKQFTDAVRHQQLEILLDIVPNHMAAASCNHWWDDVLAHGPYSRYSSFFDVHLDNEASFLLQLCSLGANYSDVLRAGELVLAVVNDRPRIQYFDHSWPVGPHSWIGMLNAPGDPTARHRAESLGARFDTLRMHKAPGGLHSREYWDAVDEANAALRLALTDGSLDGRIRAINADKALLHALMQRQFYQLHGWKLAGELCNYRRFFDVDSLVGLRTELPDVFTTCHARIKRMIEAGEIAGLRIDHPDGLRDPAAYFQSLRGMIPVGRVYVEKILENEERLDGSWLVDGTVGYDFLSKVNRLWMDDQRADQLTATYFDFTNQSVNVAAMTRQKKRDIIQASFPAELERLSHALRRLAARHWETSDLSPRHLRDALAALTAALPVYRTYRTAAAASEFDQRILSESVQRARAAEPRIDAAAFDYLLNLLMQRDLDPAEAGLVAEWQQLAPAVMAKGVEDTTFYCFDRLLSCNEVGASASVLGISNEKFHEYCHYLSEYWPNNLLATSTHDNKRSEDVRTRISVISEIPERWAEALHQWSKLTETAWKNRTPDRHAEYLLYQTLVGAWPISKERAWAYMLKACREAKIRTSWHEPNVGYEANIQGFTHGVFENPEFLSSLEAFVSPLIESGRINSLAQTLIKIVAPGVPDFYQGCEIWDLSLVDPDNRRPVDFEARAALLARCESLTVGEIRAEWDAGVPKLWMIARLLRLRRERPADFLPDSKYVPLIANGARLANVLAFQRGGNLLAVVPRFTLSIGADWGDTRLPLPKGRWRNIFTDKAASGSLAPSEMFGEFPVALYVRE
jgi:(1->4)-alpha-D-glucan 1-alpha-D-glucosylmutase